MYVLICSIRRSNGNQVPTHEFPKFSIFIIENEVKNDTDSIKTLLTKWHGLKRTNNCDANSEIVTIMYLGT